MIDIALFGLGRIGIMHGKNLMRNKDFNLKYIYDIDKNLTKKYSKILKAESVDNPNIIFKDKKIDLGTWQGIFLFEHRMQSHTREIDIHIIGTH